MIRLLYILLALIPAAGHTIASVHVEGSWVCLYDPGGACYKRLSAVQVGEVQGFGPSFFVSKNRTWIYLYDAEGNRYKTLTASQVGEVTGVAGETFTSRNGRWIYTWDREGNRLATRPYQ